MSKEEVINLINSKETWDNYRLFKVLVNKFSIDSDNYKYINDLIILIDNEKSSVKLRAFILICALASFDKKIS